MTPARPPTGIHAHRALRAALIAAAVALSFAGRIGSASGPRWVTGPPFFATAGQPVLWYTTTPLYFTDPGDLSASIDHASADALVAAAASVWNVPSSSLVLAQGGELAEHVSSEDVYLGPQGLVFPSDVDSTNYAAIQIAVIYDSDGSITDLLLGQGASSPDNCAQNGVTDSVDDITISGAIRHALLILNGRCTGPAAEQQLQMQYQLMRSFGRVLGLGWSQTNDNVFTASPLPTDDEIVKWPIMHPIDIVCGVYTYQCMPDPFTLRPDDVASISQLYFLAKGSAPAGKLDTLANASAISGILSFPNGQGMQGVNILVRRHFPASTFADEGPVVSAVTGNLYRWSNGNPVTGPPSAAVAESMGAPYSELEGGFTLGMIPELPLTELQDAYMTTEPIDPLYIGQYGIGPYSDAPVTPPGPAFAFRDNGVIPYESNYYDLQMPDTPSTCDTTALGAEAAPAPAPASGWSAGSLCKYGISAWSTIGVQANRSLTIEATALDEQGFVTENKLQPLIGVWNLQDASGTLPTVATAATPFNSIAAGLTSLNFAPQQAGALRIVVTDERGDGRPDYNLRSRILYADSIEPSLTTFAGGLVTISGMGFRTGMRIGVGGVPVSVVSSTATSVLAIAPPFAALGAAASLAVDVSVIDPMSGGSSYMYGALSYPATAVPPQSSALTMLSQNFYVAAGQQVSLLPVARLSASGAPAPNVSVSWSTTYGTVVFPDGTQSTSDGVGLASIAMNVGPLASAEEAGATACAQIETVSISCGSFVASAVDASLWNVVGLEGASQIVPATSVLQPIVFQVTDGSGHPVIGAPATIFQTISAYQVCPAHGRCPFPATYETAQSSAVSDGNGLIVVTPRQLVGVSETTDVAIAAGKYGFSSIALQKTP